MVSLVDIVPQTRTVQTAAGELELRGLGLRQIAELLLRFPSLRNLFVQNAPELGVETLLLMAPEAIAAIVAEAAGQPEAAGAIADGGLSLDDLAECLVAVRDLTMPNGAAPLLERLTKLLDASSVVGRSGRARDMSSPPLPNGSSPADMPAAK
jgi:hypothetical protein